MRSRCVTVWLGFVALALAQLWPLPLRLASATVAHADAVLNASVFGLVARQVVTAPWRPFDINMYYPFRGALAAGDPQITSAILLSPVTWTAGPLAAHNVFLILSFVIAAVGAYRLVRELGGTVAAGVLSGLVFAYSPFRLSHLDHSHVLAGCWLPFLVLSALRLLRQPTWHRSAATLAWFLILAWTSWYLTVIAGTTLLVLTVVAIATGRVPVARLALTGGVAGVIAAVALLPVLLPYLAIERQFDPPVTLSWQVQASIPPAPPSFRQQVAGEFATTGALWQNAAALETFIAASPATPVPWLRPLARFATPEAVFFPGIVALMCGIVGLTVWARRSLGLVWLSAAAALAAIAGVAMLAAASGGADAWPVRIVATTRVLVWLPLVLVAWAVLTVRRSGESTAGGTPERTDPALVPLVAVLSAGVVAWVLSLGPEPQAFSVSLGSGLYPADLPPFSLLRSPARFAIVSVLAGAVWAGFGLADILARIRQARARSWVALCVMAAAAGEASVLPVTLWPVHEIDRAVAATMRTLPPGPLVEFPIHDNTWALLQQWRWPGPLVNGSGVREPVAYNGLHGRNGLTPEMLEHLRTWFHVRYLLVDFSLYDAAQRTRVETNLRDSAAGLTMLAGVMMLALPIGIISKAFADEIHRREFVVTNTAAARWLLK